MSPWRIFPATSLHHFDHLQLDGCKEKVTSLVEGFLGFQKEEITGDYYCSYASGWPWVTEQDSCMLSLPTLCLSGAAQFRIVSGKTQKFRLRIVIYWNTELIQADYTGVEYLEGHCKVIRIWITEYFKGIKSYDIQALKFTSYQIFIRSPDDSAYRENVSK